MCSKFKKWCVINITPGIVKFSFWRMTAENPKAVYTCVSLEEAWTPAELVNIVPYAAEQYPQLFKQKEVSVLTVAVERTFREKAAILHHEANRPEHLSMPQRYSRHYYDLYCMAKSPVKEKP